MPKPDGVGTPHPRMWDRLNLVWGEERAVGIALRLHDYNKRKRLIPLTEVVADA